MPVSAGAATRPSLPSTPEIEAAIRALADERAPLTFCPSEVARRLSEDWRPLMPLIRETAARMGGIRATQGGAAIDPLRATGPIRLAKG